MNIAVHVQTKESKFDLIVVSGHAENEDGEDFDENLYQLVCAQVSAISVGILNSIDLQCPDSCDLLMDDGYVSIRVKKSSETLEAILKTFVIQLDTVEATNKKYVEIKKVEV